MGTLRLPRGTEGTLNSRSGSAGEIAFDTSNGRPRTYDGEGSGGQPLALEEDFQIEGWNDLSLQNSWEDFDTSDFPSARYRKTKTGIVFVEGFIAEGAIEPGTPVATLPEGYRPTGAIRFATVDAHGVVGMSIETSGEIQCQSVGTNIWLSITVSFSTD